MRKDYILIVLILLGAFTYQQWRSQEEKFYPGAVAQASPVQKPLSSAKSFSHGQYLVNPVASFEVRALVLSSQHYFWGEEAKLSPVDLALGWGPMSDGDILKDISISQGNRWYFYNYKTPPIPKGEMASHSANMHLIPSDEEVEKKLKKVRKGDVVEFKGYLVNLTKPDGWHWNSSQSRNDTGHGSCELVWIEEIEITDL